ncbi:MAG TPA: hypothetical protein VN962_13925 [Polyangia bacterium]|nr:hypothetical protein [Polyangia bacterium]
MPTRVLFVAVALFAAACSGAAGQSDAGAPGGRGGAVGVAGAAGGASGIAGASGAAGADGALIDPPGLDVELEQGGAGLFDLTALTLRDGPDGLELYASLTNVGDLPACDAALKVTINDKNNQPLGMFINGLDTSHLYLYTLPDGSQTIAACASPGDVTMTNIFTMAPDIAVADVGSVVYYYVYFVLDGITLIDPGFTVTGVQAVTGTDGTSYTGTFTNGLTMTVNSPSIRVFPVNRVGRPLAVAGANGSVQIPPGGTWTFQTDSVDMPGVDYAVFPAASFSN